METLNKPVITVENIINARVEKVWQCRTLPQHVTQWNHASDDWHAPHAENDLRVGGSFVYRMEAKDGSFGFNFGGVYDAITIHKYIGCTIDDGRKVEITFTADGDKTTVTESFEAEGTNSIEMQQGGWRAILNNFKKYTEAAL